MRWTIWDQPAIRASKVEVNQVGSFDARGMRRVYGRFDHYPGSCTFRLDLWCTKDGRLLARFWSRSFDVQDISVEVLGFTPSLPSPTKGRASDERWVPRALREAYDDWIDEEMDDVRQRGTGSA